MNYNDPYLSYYKQQQLGHGVSSVYQGSPYQRGHGIGSFLGGLFRTITPLLKSGASALGKEALRHGIGFLGDIASGTTLPKEAAGARFKQFTGSLKRKADEKLERVLSGGGIGGSKRYKKRRMPRVSPQSLKRLLQARINTSVAGGKKKRGRKGRKGGKKKRRKGGGKRRRKISQRKSSKRKIGHRGRGHRKLVLTQRDIFN